MWHWTRLGANDEKWGYVPLPLDCARAHVRARATIMMGMYPGGSKRQVVSRSHASLPFAPVGPCGQCGTRTYTHIVEYSDT